MQLRDIIRDGSRILGIELTQDALTRMLLHLEMVIKWNHKAGLTSIVQPEEMAIRHVLDSLKLFKNVPRGTFFTLLDVGTGAGFPGFIVLEADPTVCLTVLDRNPRKIVFLKHLAKRLGLGGVRFLNQTVESLLSAPGDQRFDYVVSRAFSSGSEHIEALAVLLAKDGGLIHMGGPSVNMDRLRFKNMQVSDRWEGSIPFSEIRRVVTVYRKTFDQA